MCACSSVEMSKFLKRITSMLLQLVMRSEGNLTSLLCSLSIG